MQLKFDGAPAALGVVAELIQWASVDVRDPGLFLVVSGSFVVSYVGLNLEFNDVVAPALHRSPSSWSRVFDDRRADL